VEIASRTREDWELQVSSYRLQAFSYWLLAV